MGAMGTRQTDGGLHSLPTETAERKTGEESSAVSWVDAVGVVSRERKRTGDGGPTEEGGSILGASVVVA